MPHMLVVVDDEGDQVLKGPTFIGDENLDPEIMKVLEGAHSKDYNAYRSPFPPRKVLELLESRGYKVQAVTNLKETLIWTLHKNRPVGKKAAGGAAVTKKQPEKSGKAANTRANSKSGGSAEQSGVDEEEEGSGSEDNEPAPVRAPAKKAAAAATGPKKAVAKRGRNPTISDNDE